MTGFLAVTLLSLVQWYHMHISNAQVQMPSMSMSISKTHVSPAFPILPEPSSVVILLPIMIIHTSNRRILPKTTPPNSLHLRHILHRIHPLQSLLPKLPLLFHGVNHWRRHPYIQRRHPSRQPSGNRRRPSFLGVIPINNSNQLRESVGFGFAAFSSCGVI